MGLPEGSGNGTADWLVWEGEPVRLPLCHMCGERGGGVGPRCLPGAAARLELPLLPLTEGMLGNRGFGVRFQQLSFGQGTFKR